PRTIEQCFSSNVWLKEGIQLSGSFDKAQKIINTLLICCDFVFLLIR
ncbi:hypothetical protein VP01_4269g1, partial [Puccinia sorghi]